MIPLNWYGYTRCPKCHVRLGYTDTYGDYNVWVSNGKGGKRRKSEERWFDPDWVIEQHLRTNH